MRGPLRKQCSPVSYHSNCLGISAREPLVALWAEAFGKTEFPGTRKGLRDLRRPFMICLILPGLHPKHPNQFRTATAEGLSYLGSIGAELTGVVEVFC